MFLPADLNTTLLRREKRCTNKHTSNTHETHTVKTVNAHEQKFRLKEKLVFYALSPQLSPHAPPRAVQCTNERKYWSFSSKVNWSRFLESGSWQLFIHADSQSPLGQCTSGWISKTAYIMDSEMAGVPGERLCNFPLRCVDTDKWPPWCSLTLIIMLQGGLHFDCCKPKAH